MYLSSSHYLTPGQLLERRGFFDTLDRTPSCNWGNHPRAVPGANKNLERIGQVERNRKNPQSCLQPIWMYIHFQNLIISTGPPLQWDQYCIAIFSLPCNDNFRICLSSYVPCTTTDRPFLNTIRRVTFRIEKHYIHFY